MNAYPSTAREPVSETRFGETLVDPYRWLEDGKSPRVEEWMRAQDAYARRVLARLPQQAHFRQRIGDLLYIPALGMPEKAGNRYFYSRKDAYQEKYVEVCREGLDGPERVLLDPSTLSSDGSISLGAWAPSYDGAKVAYTLRGNNSDEATLHVLDVATGQTSAVDVIPGAKYASPSWTPRGDGFYYTRLPVDPAIPADVRPGKAEIRFHRLGDDPAHDPLIHAATGDPRTFLSADLAEEGRWLFVYVSHGWAATDIYYQDVARGDGRWLPLALGLQGEARVVAWRDKFYIQSADGTPRGAVYVADPAAPQRAHWRTIVPEAAAALKTMQVIGGRLALTYTRDAVSKLELRDLDGTHAQEVKLPGLGSCHGLSGRAAEDEAFYDFQSFTVPPQYYRLLVAQGESRLWDEIKVPVDPTPYVVRQVFFKSKDGTRVPMFVVGRKDAPRDGNNPVLLTGYGGFSVSLEPTFSASLYAWLEAGGSYAVANLRGGAEYGEEWHRAGMLHKKQNVFDDFEAAADTLIAEQYTSPAKLAILGGSNGGLLVGAALTQRPELYRAVVCAVPLLDMLRYTEFGSGRTWIEEYGDPANAEDYQALRAYSPYQHVVPGVRYPAVLMLSADSDDRVDPMHARKMVAALQAAGGGPFLLRIEQHAGHGGADLIRSTVEQKADIYAFLAGELGVAPAR